MSNPSTPPSIMVRGAAQAAADGWQRWSAMFQAQLGFVNRLALLYRNAARESQAARSPVQLLSIQMNFQKAILADCTAFATDCFRAVSGLRMERRADGPDHHRSPGDAVAPVIGALTEPIIEGVQAALFAAASAPTAALTEQAPQAKRRATAASSHVDTAPHASARRPPETSPRRREGAPSRAHRDKKPVARREPDQKQPRVRGRK